MTDEVISDGVQEHKASECRWTPSRIYPGHEACLVNGAAHYREAEAAPLDRDRLFDEIDERFGRNVARFVDARLSRRVPESEEGA